MISIPYAVPFDSEPRHTRLLSQDIPPHTINVWLRRWLGVEFFRVVFVVHVVSNADKLSALVAACEEDDSDTKDL